MNLIKSAIFAILAGLLGAAVWAAIAYFANFELGWIAWGIGFAVGAAALAGSSGCGGPQVATLAVVISVLSVLGGKYAAVSLSVTKVINENGMNDAPTEEILITYIADDVAKERMDAGEEVWLGNSIPEDLSSANAYPPAVWAEAQGRWDAMSDAEKSDHRAVIEARQQDYVEQWAARTRADAFTSSFSPWDLLWFGLAVFTAFKLGMTNAINDSPPPDSSPGGAATA